MNIITGKDFEGICRTCMNNVYEDNNEPDHQWQYITDTVGECGAMCVAELLSNTIRKIEVQMNDELPNKICCDCLRQLVNIYGFQQMCIDSELQMRALIAKKDIKAQATFKDASLAELCENIFTLGESSLEAKEPKIVVMPEASQPNAADPLQDDTNECFKDVTEFIKMEQSDDGMSVYTDSSRSETLVSHIELKDEIIEERQAEEEAVSEGAKHTPIPKIKHEEDETGKKTIRKRRKKEKPVSFPCKQCEKTYKSRQSLHAHKKIRHVTEEALKQALNRFVCKICEKRFKSNVLLKSHQVTHTDERPHLCQECGKSFKALGILRQHRLRHTNAKSYECPECPAKFPCSSDLSKHKSVHQKIKPHVCDICGSRFSRSYSLRHHKRCHMGEKPYKCDYCDMRFIFIGHKRRHMLTHTGEKPYKCRYCDRAFAQSNDMVKHLRVHLGENVYRCDFCPSAHRKASELRLHLTTHKNEDDETRERNLNALKEAEAKLLLKLAAES